MQASMKLAKEQLVALSSAEMVQNYLIAQKSRIADSVKQSLAVAEIFKLENLQVGSVIQLSHRVVRSEHEDLALMLSTSPFACR